MPAWIRNGTYHNTFFAHDDVVMDDAVMIPGGRNQSSEPGPPDTTAVPAVTPADTAAVDAAVTRPFASNVNTGTAEADP
jgi:hypothetical protein